MTLNPKALESIKENKYKNTYKLLNTHIQTSLYLKEESESVSYSVMSHSNSLQPHSSSSPLLEETFCVHMEGAKFYKVPRAKNKKESHLQGQTLPNME